MASLLFLFSLLLTVTVTATATTSISTTTISAIPPSQPLSPKSSPIQEAHLNSILDAILNAGDFRNWANLLSEVDPSTIPFYATIFVPDDDAFLDASSKAPPDTPLTFIDPLLFPYHIIPHRFTFSDLKTFPTGARLPTLLPSNTLLITNNSAVNFTVDSAKITRPDLYQNGAVCVHGISGVLDYVLFGNANDNVLVLPPANKEIDDVNDTDSTKKSSPETELEEKVPGFVQVSAGGRSQSRSCSWVTISVAVCVVFFYYKTTWIYWAMD